MDIVVAAVIAAVPATIAAVASWRGYRGMRTGNGYTAGQTLDLIRQGQAHHELLDEIRFGEVNARLDRLER